MVQFVFAEDYFWKIYIEYIYIYMCDCLIIVFWKQKMEWAQIPEEKKNLLIAEMFYFSYILSFSQYLNELKVYSKIRLCQKYQKTWGTVELSLISVKFERFSPVCFFHFV